MCTHNRVVCTFLTFFSIFCGNCVTFAVVNKEILRLALPSIASNITVPLLGLCDVTIMGHIGGATSIAAIAVGSMIFNVIYWLFGFLRMGTSGITAQAYGRAFKKETEEWGGHDAFKNAPLTPLSILRSSLRASLLLGAAIVLLQIPLQWLSFWLMQMQDAVGELCLHYYYICVWGAPAMLGLYSLTGWFIGMQDTRTPMTIAIGQNVMNILLSLFLVLVLHLGIVGIALGTLASQWAAFLAALFSVKRMALKTSILNPSEFEPFKLIVWTVQSYRLNGLIPGEKRLNLWGLDKSHVKVYLDIFLRTLCLVAVNLYFTSAGSAQGALTLAANTLLLQFFMFFSYVMDGFAFAGEALAGKSYGAGDSMTLQRVVRLLFYWGMGVTAVFTIAYWLLGTEVLRLLTSDAEVVLAAEDYMMWAVLIPMAGMAAFVWDGIFIGITATRGMLWSCLLASVAFFSIYLLLAPTMGNHALWLALLVYLALRGLLQTIIFKKGRTA